MRELFSLCGRTGGSGRWSCSSTPSNAARSVVPADGSRSGRCALGAVALVLAGCGGGISGAREFDAVRVQAPSGPALEWGASSAKRFGFAVPRGERPAPGGAAGSGGAVVGGSDARNLASGLAWDLPTGWEELAPTSMRVANFRVGDAECYLTLLGGDGGGLAANVNRWRGQLGLGPMGAAELDALPRQPFFGGEAVRVDFEGAFSGMGGGAARDGFRLVGLLSVAASGSAFLKFVGPAGTVGAELAGFDRLAASFRPAGAPGPDVHGADPHGADPHGAGGLPTTSAAGARSERYAWIRPDAWVEGPPRMMREVTFTAGAVECYVAELPGDAGGIRANFDRWRGQLGADPLSEAEFDALERFEMLGVTARLIEIEGDFEGMGGETLAGARMLGAVAFLGDRTVFVKLVGPADAAAAERERFLAFCRSLERLP